MKIFIIIILTSFLTVSFHAQVQNSPSTEKSTNETGWPKDIDGLIAHLNSWDKEELNNYEQPNLHPNLKTSGETNGWISEHKKLLKEFGATVIWNKREMKYELEDI